MAQQLRAQFADNFSKFYDEVAERSAAGANKDYMRIIHERSDNSSRVDVSELSGVGYLSITEEGDAYDQGELIPGFKESFIHDEFGKTLALSHQAVEDDEHNIVKSLTSAGELVEAAYATINLSTAQFLHNLFSTAGADGQNGYSNSHPINSQDSGNTLDNLLAGALTYTNLELAEQQISENFKAENGRFIPEKGGRQLIVPATLRQQAFKIMNSLGVPGTDDNDKNRFASSAGKGVLIPYEIVDFRELTSQSTTAWHIRLVGQNMFRLYMRSSPKHNSWKDNNPVTYNFSCATRYSIGLTNFRELWGSTGL